MENLTKADARGGGSGHELTSACVGILFSFHFISFLHILGGWPFSIADFRGTLH